MIRVYEKYGDPVLGVVPVDADETKKYGIIDPGPTLEPGVVAVKHVVEKPDPARAPSRFASIGAYILTPDIFPLIRKMKAGHNGEYVLTGVFTELMKTRPFYARILEGDYHDTGSKLGWLKANVDLALRRPDMKKDARSMLKGLLK
jgi:UTP--glucose-1-phosphate uridylyltransferase